MTEQPTFPGMPAPLYVASPSRLLAWLDCPRRYRMQYLDRPRLQPRRPRAHTSVGVATHNALRDFWDLPPQRRSPAGVAELVRASWIDVGFRDPQQSSAWRTRVQERVTSYLRGIDRDRQPLGVERSVSVKTGTLAVTGRIDRLDDRDGQLVVVDYKTGRQVPTAEDTRTSLPLALYAVAVAAVFRRPCFRVELHHLPSGTVVGHDHSQQSLARKVVEAESIASDLRRVDADFRERGAASEQFPARTSALCSWCDYREHCPEGRQVGAEQTDWAGLEPLPEAAGPSPPRLEGPARSGPVPST